MNQPPDNLFSRAGRTRSPGRDVGCQVRADVVAARRDADLAVRLEEDVKRLLGALSSWFWRRATAGSRSLMPYVWRRFSSRIRP